MTLSIQISPQDIEWQSCYGTGAGGQHVNRTQSVMQLKVRITNSVTVWPKDVLARLKQLGKSYLIQDEFLLFSANISRSQHMNRQNAWTKFMTLVQQAATPPKKRHATRPTLNSIKRRIQNKQIQSQKKQNRQTHSYLD